MALALYRKYRPATFAEVVGQEHVTGPLMTAVDSGRINHAYLFSGPRGCGKTSSARILARSLNCVEGPTSTPCGNCQSCQDLAPDGPGNIDVIEIDAASHGGVDDARELRERAFQLPVSSRYKIYIIDEAHMVSNQGFNALLKVVEEPPESVVFIFATTEPDKVLPTIRSRTHHYPFRLVPPAQMRKLLERNCESEGVTVGEAVLPLVVRAGGGSVRDSQSLLDQLIAGAGPGGISYDDALALLGVTDVALLDDMIEAIGVADGATVFGTVDRLIDAGHDPRRFAADLLDRLRDLILLAAVPDAGQKGLIDAPDDHLQRLSDQAGRLGLSTLSRLADLVHEGLTEMRGTTAPRLGLELICARMLLPRAGGDSAALTQRVERIERRLEIGGAGDRAPANARGGGSAPAPAEPADGLTPRQRAEARVAREQAQAPATPAPSTPAPAAPSTPAPETAAPSTSAPATPAPSTPPGPSAPTPAPPAPSVPAPPEPSTPAPPVQSDPAPTASAPARDEGAARPSPTTESSPDRGAEQRPAPAAEQPAAEHPAAEQPADSGWPEVVAPGSGRASAASKPAAKPEPEPEPEAPAPSPTDAPPEQGESPRAEPAAASGPEPTAARSAPVEPADPAKPADLAAPAEPVVPDPHGEPRAATEQPRQAEPAPDRAAASSPVAAPSAEPSSGRGSGFDVAEVRRQWPAVVDAIKRHSRAGAALVEATTPVRIEGSTLVLSAPGGLVRRLSDPGQQHPLQSALDEVLGVSWQISVVEKDADPGPSASEPDEPEPFDPEDETVGGPQASLDPNEVAMSLLRDELGAQPLDEQA